jgi:hypothetical protein
MNSTWRSTALGGMPKFVTNDWSALKFTKLALPETGIGDRQQTLLMEIFS